MADRSSHISKVNSRIEVSLPLVPLLNLFLFFILILTGKHHLQLISRKKTKRINQIDGAREEVKLLESC
jgi:hypothetical protein